MDKSLAVLLESSDFDLIMTLMDQYKVEIPEYKVSERKISDVMIFVATWYVGVLMKENSDRRISSSRYDVDQLTVRGLFNRGGTKVLEISQDQKGIHRFPG
mmetsp:Transcript_37213/g.90392  ORF Transcript_37213/g.90392 Transcript_37213/m.90392 type:complete len:101 (-) Transcript_37213:331-633(-)